MKMTRDEIAAWYASEEIPTKKGIVLRAIEDAGRLILGIYWDGDKIGIYILHPDGRRATKRNKYGDWGTEGITYLLGGNWCWGVDTYNTKQSWADKKSREIGEPYIKSISRCSYENRIIEDLKSIDNYYNAEQRDKRETNKAKRIQDFIDLLPDLPRDFDSWCRDVVFKGEHYMFGKAGCNTYYCTSCGKEHTNKKLKDRQTTVCKRTGLTVKVTKRRDSIEKREQVQLVQNMPTEGHKFGKCAVARHLYVWATWDITGLHIRAYDGMVLILPKDNKPCTKWFYHLNGWYSTLWSDRNKGNFRIKREYMYPGTVKEALDGTVYGSLGLEVAAASGWHMNYNNLMIDHDYPHTEYLIKGGFRSLVDDISQIRWAHIRGFRREGNDIRDILMVDGQSVARLRRNDGNYTYLQWIQAAYVCGYKIPEEKLQWFSRYSVDPHSVAFALNRMSPEQVANYIQKQLELQGKKIDFSHINALITEWKDYLNMAKKFHLDTSREMVYRPKNLKERHDELAEMIAAQRDALERERIEGEYPGVAHACSRIRDMYEWTGDEYMVKVPEGAADIMREGQLLRHCVGSTDRYFDRIAEGESYVMFLRKKNSPNTPWYTMEVEPGGKVRQLRTMGDDEGKDRKQAKDALKQWQSEICKRLKNSDAGKKELEAAEVSREKRLAEFEELRKNQNIIRNGRLAGKLLVDVLEADFKEYNEIS